MNSWQNHNEAERWVIGAVFFDNAAMEKIPCLSPADFRTDLHQKIFAAMLALHREKKPIEVISVTDYLATRGLIEIEDGQNGDINDLATNCSTASNIEYWADILRQDSFRQDTKKPKRHK